MIAEPDDSAEGVVARGAIAHLLAILDRLKARATPEAVPVRATLGAVLEELDERAFGLLLLLLALPCCIPFLYGLPQLVALPMLALCGQLIAGRHVPWLPARLRARDFAIADFQTVLTRSARYIGWVERLAHARLLPLTSHLGSRIVGLLLFVPTASILVPLPSTNTVPGIGVAITSVGLIERDGLLIIGGLLVGFIWVGTLVFFGVEGLAYIKGLISSRF